VSQSRPTLWGCGTRRCLHSGSRWQVPGDPHPLTRIAHELDGALPVADRHLSWCSRAAAEGAPRFELIGKVRIHDATPVGRNRSCSGRNDDCCSERDTTAAMTPPPLAPGDLLRCHRWHPLIRRNVRSTRVLTFEQPLRSRRCIVEHSTLHYPR